MAEPPWVRFEGEAFRRELVKFKMSNHPFKTHPFFRQVEKGETPRPTLFTWTSQFYPWLACVPLAMAERFSRCSWETRFDP